MTFKKWLILEKLRESRFIKYHLIKEAEEEPIVTSPDESAPVDKSPVFIEKARNLAISNFNELAQTLDKELSLSKEMELIDIRQYYKNPIYCEMHIRISWAKMICNYIIMIATGDMQRDPENPHRVKYAYLEIKCYDEDLGLIGTKLVPRKRFSKIDLEYLKKTASQIKSKKGKFLDWEKPEEEETSIPTDTKTSKTSKPVLSSQLAGIKL
jgi:hypothetical protein